MSEGPKYTTQLQAGLGIVPETLKLLAVWEPSMTGNDLVKAALAAGDFPGMTARRLRNLILEAFRPRYLVDGGMPARLLKAISGTIPKEDFRSLCFLFTCRANIVLADFVRQVYWPLYSAGGSSISKEDSLRFVSSAVSDGRTTSRWSESTVVRVASYLLGACTDFGLLGPMKGGVRQLSTFRITPNVVSVLAHDLHFRGIGDNSLLRHADWTLFGLEAEDALGELKRLSLRGELIVQSAGGITQVSWKHKSMEELADVLSEG
ncbi:MAG: DUF1819 family protein [Mesorhizobium sp.]|nr:MAG: DUF1819 family protein [Mesorhizobium sp.]